MELMRCSIFETKPNRMGGPPWSRQVSPSAKVGIRARRRPVAARGVPRLPGSPIHRRSRRRVLQPARRRHVRGRRASLRRRLRLSSSRGHRRQLDRALSPVARPRPGSARHVALSPHRPPRDLATGAGRQSVRRGRNRPGRPKRLRSDESEDRRASRRALTRARCLRRTDARVDFARLRRTAAILRAMSIQREMSPVFFGLGPAFFTYLSNHAICSYSTCSFDSIAE